MNFGRPASSPVWAFEYSSTKGTSVDGCVVPRNNLNGLDNCMTQATVHPRPGAAAVGALEDTAGEHAGIDGCRRRRIHCERVYTGTARAADSTVGRSPMGATIAGLEDAVERASRVGNGRIHGINSEGVDSVSQADARPTCP